MGHVREQRLIKLLENSLMEYLRQGALPTVSELETALEAAQAEHGDLVRSSVRRSTPPVRWGESSAAEFNDFLSKLSEDMDVLYKALLKVSKVGILSLNEWSARASSLEARLNKAVSRAESLLLLKSDAAGYVSFVEDDFSSLENVSDDTTAFVDTDNGEVSIGLDRTKASGADQGAAINLNEARASFEFIRRENIRNVTAVRGTSDIGNILRSSPTAYNLEVVGQTPGASLTAELKVSLPEPAEVSKVSLVSVNSNASSPLTVALQYSVDGYTWENTGSEVSLQSGRGNFVFRFDKTRMQYFKFIITKSSTDGTDSNGRPLYSFSFQEVKAFSQTFETGVGKDLYTELLYPQLGGENVSFVQASLEVCDESSNYTSIDYYLRAYNGTSYTDWVKTAPINRKKEAASTTNFNGDSGYAVVDFSTPQNKNSSSLTTTFDSSLNLEAVNLKRNYGATGLTYRFGGPNDSFANFYIPTRIDLLSDVVLARNYGYAAAKFPAVTSDLTVRDIPCGWGLVGEGTYYCAFYISNPSGRELDFGQTTAVIDGKIVSGVTSVTYGWHIFKTNRANWIALSGSSNPSTLAELKGLDPLYPYNHKYIIEGFQYTSDFSGEKVYKGVDRYCQLSSSVQTTTPREVGTARRVGIFDLFNSRLDTSIFALDHIDTDKTILVLKVNSGKYDQQNERVRLYYTRRYESFDALELRASLITQKEDRTPALSYYRVRVK